jgi:hypothetical protein
MRQNCGASYALRGHVPDGITPYKERSLRHTCSPLLSWLRANDLRCEFWPFYRRNITFNSTKKICRIIWIYKMYISSCQFRSSPLRFAPVTYCLVESSLHIKDGWWNVQSHTSVQYHTAYLTLPMLFIILNWSAFTCLWSSIRGWG